MTTLSTPKSCQDALSSIEAHISSLANSRWQLHEEAIPQDIQTVTGTFKGSRIRLHTRLLKGTSAHVQRCHIARGSSEDNVFQSLTVLGIPSNEGANPLFALDAVAFLGKFAIVALDLPGGDLSLPKGSLGELDCARTSMLSSGEERDTPSFLHGLTSRHLVLMRGGANTPQALEETAHLYLNRWSRSLEAETQAVPGSGQQSARFCRSYMQAMHKNKKETKALASLFGHEWARTFLAEFFFNPALLDTSGKASIDDISDIPELVAKGEMRAPLFGKRLEPPQLDHD